MDEKEKRFAMVSGARVSLFETMNSLKEQYHRVFAQTFYKWTAKKFFSKISKPISNITFCKKFIRNIFSKIDLANHFHPSHD